MDVATLFKRIRELIVWMPDNPLTVPQVHVNVLVGI